MTPSRKGCLRRLDDHTHIATEIRHAHQPAYAPTARSSGIDDLVIRSLTGPRAPGRASPDRRRGTSHHDSVSLNGTLTGDYHVAGKVNADKGLDYVFSGNGSIGPLGHVHVTGNVHSLGNVATGHANGLIVLSTPKGSLTLHLTGPEQKGFANLPDHFTFKITNSSGKYLGDQGTGTVVFVRDPAGTSATPEHGTFTMVFVS